MKSKHGQRPASKNKAAPRLQGEGNYDAARRYNQRTRTFVDSGKVTDAARDAAPVDEAEARALGEAERAGRERAREEDPAVDRGRSLLESDKRG